VNIALEPSLGAAVADLIGSTGMQRTEGGKGKEGRQAGRKEGRKEGRGPTGQEGPDPDMMR